MSEKGFQLSEADLDQALDRLLMGGPEAAGDQVAARALEAIGTQQPRRRRVWGPIGAPRWRSILAVATLLLAVVVGYGVWRSVDLVVSPTPSPVPSATPVAPSPTPRPTAAPMATRTYALDGYEISVPETWPEQAAPAPGIRVLGGEAQPAGAISISYGATNGAVRVCLFNADCHEVTATSLDAFAEELRLGPLLSVVEETEVDGQPARLFTRANLNDGEHSFRGVITMHGTRPLLLSFGASSASSLPLIARIAAGFHFLETTTYSYPDAGYRITLPDEWAVGDPGSFYHVGAPERHLSTVAGTRDGHLLSCQLLPDWVGGFTPYSPPPCLDLAFGSTADLYALFPRLEYVGPLVVGGEETRALRQYSFDGYYYVVPVVHNGRPYLIYPNFTKVVDAFNVPKGTVLQLVKDALSGFEFLP